MVIMDMIQKAAGLSAISQQLGITPQEAQSGADALLPRSCAALARRLRRIGPQALTVAVVASAAAIWAGGPDRA